MHATRSFGLAVTLAALCALAAPARAGDPPAAAPSPPRKIAHPVLDGLVGSWDVAFQGGGMTGAGVLRVSKVAGGTVLLQESRVSVMGNDTYVLTASRVDDGGKTLKAWRFDTLHPVDVTAYRGTLSDTGFDLKSEGESSLRVEMTDAGYKTTLSGPGMTFTTTYTKAAKDVDPGTPNAPKDGLRTAMIGTWDASGEWAAGVPKPLPMTGTSKFRWALGGAMIVHEYERKTGATTEYDVGLHRGAPDGSAEKIWWLGSDGVDPIVIEGSVEGDVWRGKGAMPDGVELGLELTKKPDSTLFMRYTAAGAPAGSETYRKRK